MPRSGRRGPTAVAAALALLILPLTAPPGIALDVTDVQRYEGASPAETAVAISQDLFPSATDAVLIRDDGAGPAEYGSTVAASVGGPVLISDQGDVPAVTIAELDRLNVTDVHLMGDPSVLDGTVAAELAGAGVTAHRLPGALQAAEAVAGAGTPLETVYLVSDAAPAEQIVAGPAAAATGTVALEVAPGALPAPVATFLADHSVARAVMVGQTGEDGQGLADLLEAAGVEPVPLYGRDLPETSVALSETSFHDPTEMVLANDSSISSSLLGAGLGGAAGAPLLYVPASPPLPDFAEGALSAHAANLTALSVVGPTTEVDEDLVDAAVGAADPIEPLPLEDVEPGMTGIGYTVVRGIDPVAFDVEVIDVIPDGIAVDLDMILVRTSGPVIEEIGGIAAGFSGSPVYVDVGGERKLMGAVAYGCGGCDQRIGGVTPAEDMLEVLDYPNPSATMRSSASGPVSTEVQGAGGTIELRRLDLPTAVGGLLPRRIRKVQRDLERAGYDIRPFSSGTSGGPVFQPFDPLFPGHSWAGVVASGALSFSGIGTTTYRDGDRSLAFGHPFFFQGRTSLGLSSARVHHVLGDPSHIFGGFKIASVTAAHGIMQQDRLAAVAGAEGIFPHQADLDYDLLNLDSGKEFSFRTDAVPAELFADIAALSLLGALDRTFDEIGGGTVFLTTTIEGRDQDGAPFSVTRTNRFANDFDVTFESIFELLGNILRIAENGSDRVTFDAVDVSGTLTDQVQLRRIVQVRARSTSFPAWRTRRLLAEPGDRITVQGFLERPRGDTIVVESKVRAPRRGGAMLLVRGGAGSFFEGGFFDEGGGSAPPLEEVLASIEEADRNDQLIVEVLRPRQDEAQGKFRAETQLVEVVEGVKRLRVQVVRR